MVRLFVCLQDKSIEELPDYAGPMIYDERYGREVPAHDPELEYIIEPHRRKDHRGHLITVEDEDWKDSHKRQAIIKQIWEGAGHTGFEPETYAVRNTIQEDALKCFSAHRRPQDGCIDWHDRSKRLGNPLLSDGERKATQRFGFKRTHERFLCDYCPVASHHVQKKVFEKEGLYD